jgi:hypothetical protein
MQKPLLWTVLLRSYHGSKDLGTLTIVVLLFVCSSNHWASHTIGTVNFLQQSQTTTNGHNGSFFSFIRKVWHIRSTKSMSSSHVKTVHLCIEKFFERL